LPRDFFSCLHNQISDQALTGRNAAGKIQPAQFGRAKDLNN